MEVRVLGNVQDGGVPHLGCSCELCDQARTDPARQRYASSLLLAGESTRYLIDATPDIRFQLRGDALDGVLLTHEHLGHLPGLLYLGPESLAPTQLPVYCTPQLAEFIRTTDQFARLLEQDHITLSPVEYGSAVDLADGIAIPRAVPHRSTHADTVAYRLGSDRTLLYMSDLDRWTDETIRSVADADIALVDGTFWRPEELDRYEEVPHPAITRSMDVLDPTDTEIYFTHLNHTNPVLRPGSEERREVERRGFHVVEQDDVFTLG